MQPELTEAPGSATDAPDEAAGAPRLRVSTSLSRVGETVRQTSLLFSAQTGSLVAGFGASLLQARFMELTEVGRFAFCLSIVVITGQAFEFGVSSTGARVLALEREHEGERSAVGALLLMTLAMSAAFAIFIAAAAAPIDWLFQTDVRWLLVITAPLAFFQPLQPLIEQCCQGLNQIRRLSIFQVTMSLTYVGLLSVLAWLGKMTAATALASYLTGIAVASIWALIQLRPRFIGSARFVKFTLKETRRYGLNLYLARMAGMASSRSADQLVITFFKQDPALRGAYFIIQKFANPLVTLARSLSMTRFRTFARTDKVSGRVNRWNAVVLVAAAAALILAGPIAVRWFFPKYGEATWLLLPFSLAGVFAGLFQPYNIFLASQGCGRELRNIVVVVGLASLAGLWIAVPIFGLGGAAWVAASMMALDYVLHLYYYRVFRRSQIKMSEQT